MTDPNNYNPWACSRTTIARVIGVVAAALSAVALANPALAALFDEQVEGADLFRTWQEICYSHTGNVSAQLAAVKASSEVFVEEDDEEDGTRVFSNKHYQVRILNSPKGRLCGMRGRVSPEFTMDQAEKMVEPVLGKVARRSDDYYFWDNRKGEKPAVYGLTIHDWDGDPIAAFVAAAF